MSITALEVGLFICLSVQVLVLTGTPILLQVLVLSLISYQLSNINYEKPTRDNRVLAVGV